MNGWRQVTGELCRDVARVHALCADPGALAVLEVVEPELRRHAPGGLFVEGWAAGPNRPLGAAPFAFAAMEDWGPGTALWIGARMDFARTRELVHQCRRCGVRSLFLFDHWKNYTASFLDIETGEAVVPEDILVPDALAAAALTAAWEAVPALASALPGVRLRVFGQPAIEKAVERIRGLAAPPAAGESQPQAALFLDPYPSGGDFGYDVPSVIDFLADWLPGHRPGVRVLVKPHPRQSPRLVREDFAAWRARGIDFELVDAPLEGLVARAGEVWGMTSVALLIALAAGRPIVSFQPGRNLAGERESNSHLERYVVL